MMRRRVATLEAALLEVDILAKLAEDILTEKVGTHG
jgi:hypothetical protein